MSDVFECESLVFVKTDFVHILKIVSISFFFPSFHSLFLGINCFTKYMFV